ncbi:hypothetical protein [Microbacterium pumilum]|uniref:Uncharacterized protein n=1 Tax=Microbacterium pumilum TaxID=344165 RepID=A0ABN2T3D8_9MICO
MLSTVYAAEAQFRHETRQRVREFAILESIRNRKEALAAPMTLRAAARQPVTWPRPIGVKLNVSSGTAVCV